MIRISDAEMAVMKVVWNKKRATSGEIIRDLKEHNWSYNTIRTLLSRLYTKGAVDIVNKDEKMHIYEPLIDEKEYKIEITREILRKLYDDSITEFCLCYCKSEGVTEKELNKLISEIKKQKENIKKGSIE